MNDVDLAGNVRIRNVFAQKDMPEVTIVELTPSFCDFNALPILLLYTFTSDSTKLM